MDGMKQVNKTQHAGRICICNELQQLASKNKEISFVSVELQRLSINNNRYNENLFFKHQLKQTSIKILQQPKDNFIPFSVCCLLSLKLSILCIV